MIVLRATRISTKLRDTPYTETTVEKGYGVVYVPSIDYSEKEEPNQGTYEQGLHRISGYVFSLDNNVAETLFAITDAIDLIVYYTTDAGEARKRTLANIMFGGKTVGPNADRILRPPIRPDAEPLMFGVPFVVQIPSTEKIGDHVTDEEA